MLGRSAPLHSSRRPKEVGARSHHPPCRLENRNLVEKSEIRNSKSLGVGHSIFEFRFWNFPLAVCHILFFWWVARPESSKGVGPLHILHALRKASGRAT